MADVLRNQHPLDDVLLEARGRVLQGHRSRHTTAMVAWALSGAAAATVLLVLGSWLVRPPPAIEFTVGSNRAPGMVGSSIVASSDALQVDFSDGTRIVMQDSTRARVIALSAYGANMVLEQGRLGAHVQHTGRSQWKIHAGPIDVEVTGTEFEMQWDPAKLAFELSLREGSVWVRGCQFRDGLSVRQGETVRAQCSMASVVEPSSDAASQNSEPQAQPMPRQSAENRLAEPTPSSASESGAVRGDWRSSLRARKYRDALIEAQKEGFDQVCSSASAEDLLLLADAARYEHDVPRGRQALLAVRARFRGSAAAASAAFSLGTIAFDSQRDPAGAAGWFERYLAESRGGPYAREAIGRLMEARMRLGDPARASQLAREYLSSYPEGPHASVARKILGND